MPKDEMEDDSEIPDYLKKLVAHHSLDPSTNIGTSLNDELLYDPIEDEENQNWITQKAQKSTRI